MPEEDSVDLPSENEADLSDEKQQDLVEPTDNGPKPGDPDQNTVSQS